MSPMWWAGAAALLGAARWLSGEAAGARAVLRRVVEEGRGPNVNAELAALGWLSVIASDERHWEEAESYATEATRRFAESGFGRIPPMIIVFLAQAKVLAHRGESAARELAGVAASMFEQRELMWPWVESLTAALLAEIYLDLNDVEESQRWTEAASDCLLTWPDAGILCDRVGALKDALLQRRGIEPLTMAEMRVLELLPTQLTGVEIAARLFLSASTVRTHVRDIYGKLDATSRTQAVERAREVGLLPIQRPLAQA